AQLSPAGTWNRDRRKQPEQRRRGGRAVQTTSSPRRRRRAPHGQQRARFCSRSTPCFTPADARGNLRRTSPSDAQAASFSPSAARDCPSRSSASGALALDSYLVETLRKASAASRKRCRWNMLSPSQYVASPTSRSSGYLHKKPPYVLLVVGSVVAQTIAIGDIISIGWGLGGRDRGKHTAGSGRVACRLRRHATGGRACGRKIERRATPACAGNTERLLARL